MLSRAKNLQTTVIVYAKFALCVDDVFCNALFFEESHIGQKRGSSP